ncbi:TPA: hypothetical protein N0F65_004943 [Lagenidium giganteum]|uniref:Ribosomal RNA-processing protein 8 n=1 Tax=Lagenidium giganteum TaxID=4803 RepID=A0AAV2YW36_9STRA|nr:TPA: hypothetical protein N0F65_004943 [Lagenidium giganteum]
MARTKTSKGNAQGKKGKNAKNGGGKKENGKKQKVVKAPAGKVPQPKGQKQQPKQQKQGKTKGSALSSMQEEMRRRLDGGKFRMLNEQLYTSTGSASFKTFQADPELFDVYHQGFREQAEKWPVNPLDTFIDFVKYDHQRRQPKAIVADFGCGDARLAESVPNQVHSFDLVSRKPIVTACNIADVPLPNASIDIGVFCLALMGSTVSEYIIEAHRVLKPKGVLKIAEVKSRFETEELGGISGFVDCMQKLGFDLKHKDEQNKMFALFEFTKTKRKPQKDVTIELKACEYKRR